MLTQLQNAGAFTQRDLDACNRNFNLTGGLAYGAAAVGQIFCVDKANGNDNSGDGTPEKPFSTITLAHEYCVSGRGDSIVVQAGEYNESVNITKDYVTLIGMTIGGYARPDLGPAASGEAALTINGQGCAVIHVRCAADGGDALVQRGNGFIIADCVLDGDGTGSMASLRLLPSDTDDSYTASEGRIFGNYIRGGASGLLFDVGAAPAVGVGSTDNRIYDNTFTQNTVDVAVADSGGGVYSAQFCFVYNNQFTDKNKAVYIDMVSGAAGLVAAQKVMFNGNHINVDTVNNTKFNLQGTACAASGNFDNTSTIIDGSALD